MTNPNQKEQSDWEKTANIANKYGKDGCISALKESIDILLQQAQAEILKEVLPKDNLIDGKNVGTEYGEGYSNGFKNCRQEIIDKALQKWGIKL